MEYRRRSRQSWLQARSVAALAEALVAETAAGLVEAHTAAEAVVAVVEVVVAEVAAAEHRAAGAGHNLHFDNQHPPESRHLCCQASAIHCPLFPSYSDPIRTEEVLQKPQAPIGHGQDNRIRF